MMGYPFSDIASLISNDFQVGADAYIYFAKVYFQYMSFLDFSSTPLQDFLRAFEQK